MKINTIKEFKNATVIKVKTIYSTSNCKKIRKVIKNIREICNKSKKYKTSGTTFYKELYKFSN